MNTILLSIIIMGLLGLFFGLLLDYFSKKFSVSVDEKVKKVYDVLPHLDCGACGYAGCMAYAEAVVKDKAAYNICKIGKEPVAKKIREIMEK